MEFAKLVFDAFDKLLDRSQNEVVEIDGEEALTIVSDIKYSKTKKFDASLDIYFDKKIKTKKPVMFYIHGGGFVAGGKGYRRAIAKWFAVQGYFVVNVNYGLSPDCVFPDQFKHLATALKWVEKYSTKYNLDLSKIVISGDSAGAYYASMLACISQSKMLQEKLKININLTFAGVVLNCGLYDLQSVLEKRLAFDLNSKIFESYTGIAKDQVDKYKYKDYCSPLEFITNKFPPTFLIYAEKDIFCAGQTERFAKNLEEKDIYYESFCSKSPFINHCFSLEWKSKQAQRANILQSMFLRKIKEGSIDKKQSESIYLIREEM